MHHLRHVLNEVEYHQSQQSRTCETVYMSELEVLFFNGLFFLLHISKSVYYPKLLDDIQYNNQWMSSSFKNVAFLRKIIKSLVLMSLTTFSEFQFHFKTQKIWFLLIVTFSFFVQKIIFQTRRDNHIMEDTSLSKEVVHKLRHTFSLKTKKSEIRFLMDDPLCAQRWALCNATCQWLFEIGDLLPISRNVLCNKETFFPLNKQRF